MINHPKVLFLSHGGGPLPLLGDDGHREMVACLESIASIIPRPAAIVDVPERCTPITTMPFFFNATTFKIYFVTF